MVIYAIKHKKTGNMYIGQTIQNSKKRWELHRYCLRNARHQNSHLQRAWDKYGEESFVFEILDETAENIDQLNALEISYVATVGYYNLRNGGSSPGNLRAEHKRKLSEAHKGKVLSEEHKRKMRESAKRRWQKLARKELL